jgi:concanavalin A-like lectin/glucanase superfamily protein/putative Ig domain-containing protein
VLGGIALGQPGALVDGNTAALFNGSTGYVRVPNSAALQLTGDLTIELWLNVSRATRQTLIAKDYLHEFELTLETNGTLRFYQGDGVTVQSASATFGAIAANTWQHVVVTRTTATKTIRFYINGMAKGGGTYVTPPTTSTKVVSIGRSTDGVQYVNGRLDEVAVYPAALTAAQVAAHYARRTLVDAPTVVTLPLAASDPDLDALTYSATGLPPGLTINAATGLISGTLSAASVGTYSVTVTASDGVSTTSQTFAWTITSGSP